MRKMAYTPIGAHPCLGFESSPASLRLDSMTTTRSSLPSLGGQGGGPHSAGQLSSLARLDHQQSCAICLERYDEPRILKCSHSFCRRCLVQVLEQRAEDPENPQRKFRGATDYWGWFCGCRCSYIAIKMRGEEGREKRKQMEREREEETGDGLE